MAIFLSATEREAFNKQWRNAPMTDIYWVLRRQAERRAAAPNLQRLGESLEWWHSAAEHLTIAAMIYALAPDEVLGGWLRSTTLAIARRPLADWVGPPFRDHHADPPMGHLETAHLCWAVGGALDLGEAAFTDPERREVAGALREKGLTLCREWLRRSERFNNWRSILNAGVAVAAAVLNDRGAMDEAAEEFARLTDLFQPDGSYGESLQYGNYAALGMMHTAEALIRRDPGYAARLDLTRYARKVRWDTTSLFYVKPLSGDGWHGAAWPRSANFNDSAAVYRPSADLLLHVAARLAEASPTNAGLARWLFDTHYAAAISRGFSDRGSFGFVNGFGFLTLPLLTAACDPVTPQEAGLGACEAFDCGDVLLRDAWQGRTIIAVRGGGDPLHSANHLHGDLNSGIVVHGKERLLVDPGHCSYRNLVHAFDIATRTHNTCTFTTEAPADEARPEDVALRREVEQRADLKRSIRNREPEPPVDRGARRLIAAACGPLRVTASEVSAAYGPPIKRFARFWVLCGSHALFVVDHIVASAPVRTAWHWLLNNRDGELDLKILPPDRLVARRGDVGMKLFHLGGARVNGPIHAYVHDAYHALPAQVGEGRPGSGQLVEWRDEAAATERLAVHAIAMDSVGAVAGWHLRTADGGVTLDVPPTNKRPGGEAWTLRVISASQMRIEAAHEQRVFELAAWSNDAWEVQEG